MGIRESGDADEAALVSKADIRRRAREFAGAWANAKSEQSDKQGFWDALFQIFGVQRRQVATYEALAMRASTGRDGWVDLLLPGQMAVEHKSAGKSLDAAMAQLIDYLPSLRPAEHPWLLVVSDFQHFQWQNLDTGESGTFPLHELPSNVDLFWWLAGYQVPHRQFADEVAANLAATQLMADLYDTLVESGYPVGDAREWATRILFCLFADDADVWDRGGFHSYLALHTAADGHDLGDVISRVFRVLNTDPTDRPGNLDEDLAQFTYINGDLFGSDLWPVTGTAQVRDALLTACAFDWSEISPAIFGSLFQNVMTAKERRQLGAHYTTEQNILRTIRPLFLDQLEAELAAATSAPKLAAFHDKIAALTFLDPACGCGNFLVIAYRELRRLETECLRRLSAKTGSTGQRAVSLALLCKVRVDQFYGIEIEEFPARIARTALYLMDHLANRRASIEFGEDYQRFPIPASPHIQVANALRQPWSDLLPAPDCHYLLGNPPFAGQVTRAPEQTVEMRAVWGSDYARWLDYVSAWYRIAADYIAGQHTRAAFVSTNSITQGEQVARIWRPLLSKGIEIDFAHRTFAWSSEANGTAAVHVVIVGFSWHGQQGKRTIYEYPDKRGEPIALPSAANISPYLIDAPNILVDSRAAPLSPVLTPVRYGNKPSDGGHLIVEPDDNPPDTDPAAKYLRPFIGARELLHGGDRLCIWMEEPDPHAVASSQWLRNRLHSVQQFRADSSAKDTQGLASRPWRFFRIPQPSVPYIAIPRVVSENRRWFTVAHEPPDVIASDSLFTAVDPDGLVFAVLSSAMFITWLRSIGGTLESRLRFSGPMVYNTFPLRELTPKERTRIITAGIELRQARDSHPGVCLADLYDPLSTPTDVLAAHKQLDLAVDRIFTAKGRPSTDPDRLKLLLPAYSALLAAR